MRLAWIFVAALVAACSSSGGSAGLGPDTEHAPRDPSASDSESDTPDAPDPAPFPLDERVPYFTTGDAAEALRRYRRQEFSLAAEAAERAIAGTEQPAERHRLRILLAVNLRELGDWSRAAALFAEAAADDTVIPDYLHFQAARALARAGEPGADNEAARVRPESPWARDTAFLLAESARAAGRHEQAIAGYRDYLDEQGEANAELTVEARYRLGESLLAASQKEEAMRSWRRLVIAAPVSTWAELARAALPGVEADLTASERMERGMAYFHAMRNGSSEADFALALEEPGLSAEDRCQALFHRAKSVYKERQYARSAPLFVPAIGACKASGNTNYEVKSAYQAGLAFGRANDQRKAIEYHAYVERYPQHSYADDARLRQAELHEELREDARVTELLSTLPELYPDGDMRAEAMWRLARGAYQDGKYDEAVSWLQAQIKVMPIETNWWAEGQAPYWLGRSLAHLGKSSAAAEAYQDCVRLYPLTYYSMQALNRLRESWPALYESTLAELKATESSYTLSLRDRPDYASPAFRSALELARLGLTMPARRELLALGFQPPKGRDAVTDPERLDWLLAASLLLDLAGDYEQSHWIGRWHSVDYRRSWPSGDNTLRWRLAYPLAYWDLLQEFSAKYSYPAHLQMAIVREESAFDPARESYANAVGLTQMIFPTAHDHSVGSGIEVTRENLQHPVKNVTIGSHFLESLQQAFDGRVGLMVPGYNAGRARVRGWIRTRHRLDLDEFIERIKGDQARRYTKRVLGSFFTYRYLSDNSVPTVDNEVPRKLGTLGKAPKPKRKRKPKKK